jgi:hypothetical protein
MNIIPSIAALYALALVIVGVAATRAPEGYEDERGFHYGRQS